MYPTRVIVLVVLCLAALAGDVSAQGGGRGGGRGMAFERPDTPSRFDSEELGLAFDVPQGLQLYTVAAPGRYKAVLGEGRFLHIASAEMRRASVTAKSSTGATEAELKTYKEILDVNPPQAKLEGFKKHSVRFIKIGKHADKEALEFVYDAQLTTIRQVVFVHNGRGFTFTCTSMPAQYGSAETEIFKPLFARLEFR